jgi:hypothetical protein
MNSLYFIIPIMILLCLAIIFVNPTRLVLNRWNNKKRNLNKNRIQWGIPIFDKSNVKLIEHPAIVSNNLALNNSR